MKRILGLIGVAVLLLGFCGCGLLRSCLSSLTSDHKSEAEIVKEMETTIIEALNHKDRELLKSVFSEDAILKDPAMEEGIDYLFELYEGDFIEVTERNRSSSSHWGVPGNTTEISAWCFIKTSKTTYKLDFCIWTVQEQRPTKKGVYCINLYEYVEDVEYPGYYSMAGVQTPERACVDNAIDIFYDSFTEEDEAKLKEVFSEQLLNSEYLDEKVTELLQLFRNITFSDVKDIWTTDTSTETQRQRHAYMGLYAGEDYILYFRFEDWDNDKISIIKLTKIEEGKTEYDYDLGEKLTEPGIYLP